MLANQICISTNNECEWPTINTIQYLGSKARLIRFICPIILRNKSIDTVIDLFAGSGTISYALKDKVFVHANDLQRYSYTILEGILNGCNFSTDEEENFFNNASSISNYLGSFFELALEEEKSYFNNFSEEKVELYRKFCEETPNIYKPKTFWPSFSKSKELFMHITPGKPPSPNIPPCLFTTYFSNTYFGLSQCIEIDSLRTAIEHQHDSANRYVLLTALMSAMSFAASSTTHFAQFLKVRDTSTARHLSSRRQISISLLMRERLSQYRAGNLLSGNVAKLANCGNVDYLDFLDQTPLGENTLVYADPPYFKEHYSRYYHVLETLCLYDYPEITFNSRINDITTGRYRADRPSSPFGRKSSALGAFKQLFSTCAQQSAPVAVSYSNNSIVDIKDIKSSAEEWYNTEIFEFPLTHSNQGRAMSNNQVTEILLVANPRKKFHAIGYDKVVNLLNTLPEIKPLYDNPAAAMHNYMARKPYNVVSTIIRGLLEDRGTVLDPFAGSGTTLIEARKLGHQTIGIDINMQAYLLMKVSLSGWDIDRAREVLEEFLSKLKEEIENIYFIVDTNKNQGYLERCHFDLNDLGQLIPTSYWFRPINEKGGLGSRIKHFATDDFVKNYQSLEKEAATEFPSIELLTNRRIAISPGANVSDYFCARNKLAVSAILRTLKTYRNTNELDLINLLISSALNLIRLSDKKASSQIPYWRPKKDITSRNTWFILNKKVKLLIEGLTYLSVKCPGQAVDNYSDLTADFPRSLVLKAPVQDVSGDVIPDSCVDLVLTDPPYTDQIPYLEYSQLWSALLGWDNLELSVLNKEVVVSDAEQRKEKTISNYVAQLEDCFSEVTRMMKPQAFLAVFFHSFSLPTWSAFIRAAGKSGLAYQGQTRIGRQRRSFKTILSPNCTLDGNYLIIFRKRVVHFPVFEGTITAALDRAISMAIKVIRKMGGAATSQDLYDGGVLKDSIECGSLHILAKKYRTLPDVVKPYLIYEDGLWKEK